VKITTNLYLRIDLKDRLINSCALLDSFHGKVANEGSLYEKFLPYLEGKGDVNIGIEDLRLEGYTSEVIEVYKKLREVAPFGRTITYGELGKLTGKHPRFIAYCMRINRFPVIIPCHRVVAKNGLGGFSYGPDIKRRLIAFEKAGRQFP